MDDLGSTRFQLLRKLGAGGMGVVYEAYDRQTDAVVALKALQHVGADAILRFKHEFRALADIDHPNLLRFGELHCEREQWFFTMELIRGTDFLQYVRLDESNGQPQTESDEEATVEVHTTTGGAPAQLPSPPSPRQRPRRFDEARLRHAARQLAVAIAALHRSGRVHRDIKPTNVLVRADGHLILLDFGLIGEIGARHAEANEGRVLGTPYFMAPEQAESQLVGPPADWYSFGVMLFLSLTGVLPFAGLPHTVIDAKRTAPAPNPDQLCADLPADLVALCRQLLEREPDDRPRGDDILRRLGADDEGTSASSSAGQDMQSGVFVGRTEELADLTAAYARCKQGASELMLVQGEPGVGKSALVRGFLEREVALDAATLVLAGRCYEQESVPLKAFDTIIDALSVQLAVLPAERVNRFLRAGVRFLASIFPVLKRVPAIAERVPDERALPSSLSVRDQAFGELKQLLIAIGSEMPLVLFIDDLQWADKDSLGLLSALFASEPPPALFIATLRTSSQTAQPPPALAESLQTLPFKHIDLHGLSARESQQLWTTLWRADDATPISGEELERDQLLAEASGHPLFLSELVRFARSKRPGQQRHTRLLDVLWQRIADLNDPSRRYMELVALAGVPIKSQVVAHAAQLSAGDGVLIMGALRTAQLVRVSRKGEERLVEPYHDRIRESILQHWYGIEGRNGPRVRQMHLKLGRRLLEHSSDEELPASVFAIVDHLNAAATLVDTRTERRRLSELNLLAARQAKLATAYETALTHVTQAAALLFDEDEPERHFAIQREQIELEYRLGQVESAQTRFEAALETSRGDFERTELYVLMIEMQTAAGKFAEAIATARRGLRQFSVRLPAKPGNLAVLAELARVRYHQGSRPIAELSTIEVSRSQQTRCAMQLLMAMSPACYFSDQMLLSVVTLRMAAMTLKHGATPHSAFGFLGYGLVMTGGFNQFEKGFALGKLAIELDERFGTGELESKVYVINGALLTPWVQPMSEAAAQLRRADEAGQRLGDITYRTYAVANLTSLLELAAPVDELLACSTDAIEAARRSGDIDLMTDQEIHLRAHRCMHEARANPTSLADAKRSEEELLAGLDEMHTPSALAGYRYCKAMLCYQFADYEAAWRFIVESEQSEAKQLAQPAQVYSAFYRILIAAQLLGKESAVQRRHLRGALKKERGRLRDWARHCPDSFLPRQLVAEAEAARALRRDADLSAAYEAAIAAAKKHGQVGIEALALELAAGYLAERGAAAQADAHLRDAIAAYERWGAHAKADHLRKHAAISPLKSGLA